MCTLYCTVYRQDTSHMHFIIFFTSVSIYIFISVYDYVFVTCVYNVIVTVTATTTVTIRWDCSNDNTHNHTPGCIKIVIMKTCLGLIFVVAGISTLLPLIYVHIGISTLTIHSIPTHTCIATRAYTHKQTHTHTYLLTPAFSLGNTM